MQFSRLAFVLFVAGAASAVTPCGSPLSVSVDGDFSAETYTLADDRTGGPASSFSNQNAINSVFITDDPECSCGYLYVGVGGKLERSGGNALNNIIVVYLDTAAGGSSTTNYPSGPTNHASVNSGTTLPFQADVVLVISATDATFGTTVDVYNVHTDTTTTATVASAEVTDDPSPYTNGFEIQIDRDAISYDETQVIQVFAAVLSKTAFFSNHFIPPLAPSETSNVGDCSSSACDFSSYSVATAVHSGNCHSESESPVPGGGGDPIITDFAGHKFLAGSKPNTEYLLFTSADRSDSIFFTTSSVSGKENDYFIGSVRVLSETCGESTLVATPNKRSLEIHSTTDCAAGRVAMGDNGIAVVSIGDSGAFGLVLPHHQNGKEFSFINFHMAGEWQYLREDGCTGMLCDERHEALYTF